MTEIFYRYEDVQYAAPVDEFDRPLGFGSLEIQLREYTVLKHTAKGVWIDLDGAGAFRRIPGGARFVLLNARKRFACPTIAEARASFLARKRKQIRIHKAQVARAERAIAAMLRCASEDAHRLKQSENVQPESDSVDRVV
jgi:hypothetical protein